MGFQWFLFHVLCIIVRMSNLGEICYFIWNRFVERFVHSLKSISGLSRYVLLTKTQIKRFQRKQYSEERYYYNALRTFYLWSWNFDGIMQQLIDWDSDCIGGKDRSIRKAETWWWILCITMRRKGHQSWGILSLTSWIHMWHNVVLWLIHGTGGALQQLIRTHVLYSIKLLKLPPLGGGNWLRNT